MRKSILYIGPSKNGNAEIENLLGLGGYMVHSFSDGEDAVGHAPEIKPDLIISEIKLPKLDGFGVLHLLQRNSELFHIPVILIGDSSDYPEFRKAMESGADDYLGRPIDKTGLLKVVESRLHKFSKVKEYAEENSNAHAEHTDYETTVKELFANSIEAEYKNKQVIFLEGNVPQYLFYVKSGKIKAYKTNLEGKELTVGLYGPGDFVGYIAFLENSTYQVSTQALESSELMAIPGRHFMGLMKNNPAFTLEFTRELAKNNNYKADQMVQLAYNSLRKRVANALLLLKEKFKVDGENLSILISREELANLSGTTTESLIRTLSDFKSEKLIEVKGRAIDILDREKLENMVN